MVFNKYILYYAEGAHTRGNRAELWQRIGEDGLPRNGINLVKETYSAYKF